jgi:hypothetical protein
MKNGLDKYDSINYNITNNIELNSYINNRNIISDNNISIPDNDYVWIFRLSETEIDLLNNSEQIINLDCIHISKFIKVYGNITETISKENNLLYLFFVSSKLSRFPTLGCIFNNNISENSFINLLSVNPLYDIKLIKHKVIREALKSYKINISPLF